MAAMSKGCRISNKDRAIVVEKNDLRLIFDKEIKTKNGYVCGVVLGVPKQDDCCFAAICAIGKQGINNLHKKLGHIQVNCLQNSPIL